MVVISLIAIAIVAWTFRAPSAIVPELTAEELVHFTCQEMRGGDYHIFVTNIIDNGRKGRLEVTTKVSGPDFQSQITRFTQNGTLAIKWEIVVKDNIRYERHTVSEDTPDVLTEWSITGTEGYRAKPLPCFGIEAPIEEGAASAAPAERKVAWISSDSHGEQVEHEFWVNSAGIPLRGRETVSYPSDANANVATRHDGGTPSATPQREVEQVVDYTYSKWGQRNIITAPITPPTPTAIPTPDPSNPTRTPFPTIGTLHQMFLWVETSGGALGFTGGKGSLKPVEFTVGDITTTIRELKWQDGAVSLTLEPYHPLTGYVLVVITHNYEIALSLDAAAAVVDRASGTLSWPVANAPWQDGDYLMLRIRETGSTPILPPTPEPTATPTPAPLPTSAPTATPRPDAYVGAGGIGDRNELVADAFDHCRWRNGGLYPGG